MLISYTTNNFPEEYVPTVFDNCKYYYCTMKLCVCDTLLLLDSANVMYKSDTIALSLWDTAGQSDYDHTRPLSYPDTQVFLVCVSTVNRTSYENAKSKWVPEVKGFSAEIPIVIAGTKMDLRSNEEYVRKIQENGESVVSMEDGQQLMKDIEAVAYSECSAKSHKGLKEVFIACIQAVLEPKVPKKAPPKKRKCLLM
jgi:Ras-related C3 botulinum toxin substrate 1